MSNELVKQPASLASCVASDQWRTEITKVLPKEVVLEGFFRVTRTAATEAKFANVDQRSFLNALLKCARAGLPPDGILAHLIPFGREVQAIFDWKGIVDLASRSGIEVVPKVVCENDTFEVMEDDGTGRTVVRHMWGKTHRGTITHVYARARNKSGAIDFEFMTTDEVEAVRQTYSRAKDSKAWKESWGEMAKKTVIKRLSKRLPLSPEVRAAINADDDSIETSVAVAPIARPVFAPSQPTKQLVREVEPESNLDQAPPPEDDNSNPDLMPQQQAEAPKPDSPAEAQPVGNGRQNYLKAVRGLCGMAKVKEGELLTFMAGIGLTDGSQSSLEEVQMLAPDALKAIHDQWQDVSAKVIALRPDKKRKPATE